jgi:hypothetical protein
VGSSGSSEVVEKFRNSGTMASMFIWMYTRFYFLYLKIRFWKDGSKYLPRIIKRTSIKRRRTSGQKDQLPTYNA